MKAPAILAALVLALGTAHAQKKETEYVQFTKAEIEGKPTAGARVTARLHFKIEKGFHTQSHKPSEDYFIPTSLKLENVAGIKAGSFKYPEGKEEKVAGLDKPLSVYEEEFEISVPLALSAQARLPATIEGTLKYQACKGAVCFPPRELKLKLELKPE
jgi:DsbC/DsbD-like thiol-disulfide interchange protein